jgi:hypothetical protein
VEPSAGDHDVPDPVAAGVAPEAQSARRGHNDEKRNERSDEEHRCHALEYAAVAPA